MSLDQKSLEKIVAELRAEPLTHLMLGDRELFHSNLLAWFFECFEHASNKVFGNLTDKAIGSGAKREALRELGHLDLVFRWKDRRPLVIENKVFSLPDGKQLENYTKNILESKNKKLRDLKTASFCLLSLSKPNEWMDGRKTIKGHEWRWLSYRELADRIRNALPKNNRTYEVETMDRYVKVVGLLHNLADQVVVKNSNKTVTLPDNVMSALAVFPRLEPSLAKLRAASVAHLIGEALHNNEIAQNYVKTDFSRGKPLIDWFGAIPGEEYWQAGWQLQDRQFRLAIRANPVKEKEDPRGRAKCEKFAKENKPSHFEFEFLNNIIKTEAKEFPIDRDFNGYKSGFAYRAKRISKETTVKELANAAIAVANKVKSV